MKVKQILLCLLTIPFLTGFFFSSKLDTKSEVEFKSSLKKIFDEQKTEEERLKIAGAISSILTDGSEDKIKNINDAYNAYQIASMFGSAGKLMPLDGKNAEEIIKLGYEARKKWIQEKIPPQIESTKNFIDSLEKRKSLAAKIEKPVQIFSVDNATLEYSETMAVGKNVPTGLVSKFILTFDAINSGNIPVNSFRISLGIIDMDKNGINVAGGSVNIELKDQLKPGTTQRITKELSGSALPYKKGRYKISKIAPEYVYWNIAPIPDEARFDEYNEKTLQNLKNKVEELEAELVKYK